MEAASGCFTVKQDSSVAFLVLWQYFAFFNYLHGFAFKECNSLCRPPAVCPGAVKPPGKHRAGHAACMGVLQLGSAPVSIANFTVLQLANSSFQI